MESALGNFTAYNTRFAMPSTESGGTANLWYSYNYGPIHCININTESDFPGAPEESMGGIPLGKFGDQLKWLERDLEQAQQDRYQRPWIAVFGHRPIYAQSSDTTNNNGIPIGYAKKLQKWLEPLFAKYAVDFYFAGHKHRYERQFPVFNSTRYMTEGSTVQRYIEPKFTTHIVTGAGGNEELHAKVSAARVADAAEWAAVFDDANYGVGFLHIVSRTNLRWEYRSVDGNTLDTLDIVKRQT